MLGLEESPQVGSVHAEGQLVQFVRPVQHRFPIRAAAEEWIHHTRTKVMFYEGERKPHLTADCIVTTVSIITIYVVTVKMCMKL